MADKNTKEVAKKDGKKTSIWQKISKFFREYKSEMKKISWPTFSEVVKNSLITLVVVLIVGAFIWLVDWGLTSGRDAILGKIGEGNTVSASDVIDGSQSNTVDLAKAAYYGFDWKYVTDTDLYTITKNGEEYATATKSELYSKLSTILADLPDVDAVTDAADAIVSTADDAVAAVLSAADAQ